MPKYRPETAKAKATKLIKAYQKAGLSQTKLAKEEGVTKEAINQRLKKAPVQQTMAEILDKAGVTDTYLGDKIKEGCEASETIVHGKGKKKTTIQIKDLKTAHRYVTTALEVKKHIRADEDVKPMKLIVHFGHRKPKEDVGT